MEKIPVVEPVTLPPCEIFLISDLHIARGVGNDGLYMGTENFFYDSAFSRWLEYCKAHCKGKKGVLVINGDFVDFLRVIFEDGEWDTIDYSDWSNELKKVGIHMTPSQLKKSCDAKSEKDFGFKTNDFKSIWKLQQVVNGHGLFFDALANWLLVAGNELFVFKGNHDLEWYWEKVREYLIILLKERIKNIHGQDASINIRFFQDAAIVNNELYIEHGHRYDKFTFVVGADELTGKFKGQLTLPLGSFVNRYIANGIEKDYPFMDNIRPSQNIVPILLKQDFNLAVKIITSRFWVMLKFLQKRQWKYVLGPVLNFLLIIFIPIALALILFGYQIYHFITQASNDPTYTALFKWLSPIFPLIGSFLIGKIISHFNLTEPDNLFQNCAPIFEKYPQVKIITMGHTHVTYQRFDPAKNQFYINSVTWIPTIEYSPFAISDDNTYNFIQFTVTEKAVETTPLLRWNDSANRAEKVAVMENLPVK